MLVRHSLAAIATTGVDAAGGVLVGVLIGRFLGARSTGVYGYAQTLAGLALAAFGIGLPALLAQKLAEAPDRPSQWIPILRSSLSLFIAICAPLAFIAFGAFWLTFGGRRGGSIEVFPAMVSALGLAISSMVLGCTRAFGDFSTPLKASVVTKSALVLSVIGVGASRLGVDAYMAIAAVVQVGTAGLLLRRLRKTVGVTIFRWPIAEDFRVIPLAVPFGITVVLEAASFRLDTVLVEWIRGGAETGWYVAAYTIYTLPILVSYAIATAYYPWITRAIGIGASVAHSRKVAVGAVIIYGIGASLASYLLAQWLVEIAFGKSFGPAVAPFQVLSLAMPVVAANRMGIMELKGAGGIRRAALASLIAVCVSIIGNVTLLGQFGIVGAAWANLASEAALLVSVSVLGAWRTPFKAGVSK